MFIAGSFLIADWQTLVDDPCRVFSPFDNDDHQNISLHCETSKTLHDYCTLAQQSGNWTLQASDLCQATQGCRWNQFSVITNSLCTNCPAICRSVDLSLNIIQFSIGAILFMMAITMSDICLWILLSNNLHEHEQVCIRK